MRNKSITPKPFAVVITLETIANAYRQINELYPSVTGQPPSAERRDMLGWYRRWLENIKVDPFDVLGAPPFKTERPNVVRFPADEKRPISGVADVDRSTGVTVITVISIRISPPRRR